MASTMDNDPQTPLEAVPMAVEFQAFDRFPWSKHKVFLLGLVETLGGAGALIPTPTHEGSTSFCRTVLYRRHTGRQIDLTRYSSFRESHPEYPSIDRRLLSTLYSEAFKADSANGSASPREAFNDGSQSRRIVDAIVAGPLIDAFDGTPTPPLTGNTDEDIPFWQRNAPTDKLQVPRESAASASHSQNGDTGEAPYSDKFAKIVEAIQTGKELEGIRQIPDTVVRQPGITPIGKLKAPKKPWETAATAVGTSTVWLISDSAAEHPVGGALVDPEFPPPAQDHREEIEPEPAQAS